MNRCSNCYSNDHSLWAVSGNGFICTFCLFLCGFVADERSARVYPGVEQPAVYASVRCALRHPSRPRRGESSSSWNPTTWKSLRTTTRYQASARRVEFLASPTCALVCTCGSLMIAAAAGGVAYRAMRPAQPIQAQMSSSKPFLASHRRASTRSSFRRMILHRLHVRISPASPTPSMAVP